MKRIAVRPAELPRSALAGDWTATEARWQDGALVLDGACAWPQGNPNDPTELLIIVPADGTVIHVWDVK